MPRPLLIKTSEYPYHVNARANNKEWFYLEPTKCWKIFCYYLCKAQKKFNIDVHAFLMMNNHIHLLISTPNSNIDKFMHYFMMMTSREIGTQAGRINKIWGSRYYKSLITNEEYYAHALWYIFTNPIEAHITNKVENYNWSTLQKENYKDHADLIVQNRPGFDVYVPDKKDELIYWLNKDADRFYREQTRKALKKIEFKFAKHRGVNEEYYKKFLTRKKI